LSFSDWLLPPVVLSSKRLYGALLAVAVLYYGAARLGLLLAFETTNVSPVWPPTGIALAAVLLLGYRVWPAIFAGAFLANAVVFVENRSAAAWILPVSAAIALGNTLEALTGAFLLRRFSNPASPFRRSRDAFVFVLVAMLMCLVSASIGSVSLFVAGVAPWGAWRTIGFTWWLGDAAGALVVTPLLITWVRRYSIPWSALRRVEAAALAALLFAVGQGLFGGWFAAPVITSLPYVVLPFLLWAAFRFGPRGAASAAALASVLAIWGTIHHHGPFAGASLNDSLLLLQAFVCVTAVTAIVLAATVDELRQAEELNRSAAQLKRTNEELAQFADVVSHDLKAPLRGIISLATWIAEDNRDVLGEEGQENLKLMVGRSHRMNNLIEGILQYSRAGRQALRPEPIETSSTVAEVIATIVPPDTIVVTIEGDLPTVVYDRTQLTQIFQNLIDNAVRHMGKPEGEVVVSCRDARGFWEFCVRDSGVGIPEQHFERIFKMFQTLKPKDEVESTGIGLSLVKRYVERHGGAVEVRSTVGEGSSFFFTVPKQTTRRPRALEEDSWNEPYGS
jgi:signal transduction histidine kinase